MVYLNSVGFSSLRDESTLNTSCQHLGFAVEGFVKEEGMGRYGVTGLSTAEALNA